MGKIKTKDMLEKTVKTLDRTALASQRMKTAYREAKEKAEQSTQPQEENTAEYAGNQMESTIRPVICEGSYQVNQLGQKSVSRTADNVQRARAYTQKRFISNRMKQAEQAGRSIKIAEKEAGRTAGRTIKSAEQTAKTALKTSRQTAEATRRGMEATAKASERAWQAAREGVLAMAGTAKAVAKATAAAVKAIITALQDLIAAVMAGGWIAVVVIAVICMIALLTGSVYGIFFSGEDSGTGMSMQTAVADINEEYNERLEEAKTSVEYDVLEMSGSRAVWEEVLAVYAVKVNLDSDTPQEVATMDENKLELLREIFWEMNEITSEVESVTETYTWEEKDEKGNLVIVEEEVTTVYLYITIAHKTAEEMAELYGFREEQRAYLEDLLSEDNASLWAAVLYGIRDGSGGSGDIVSVALSQVGNVGGDIYWSWYGFGSHVDWCACFVSWCANECGYIDSGVIPKFSGCVNGSQWFKARGQWQEPGYVPSAGDIIFFDWERDGVTDHVGIVQYSEGGMIYTVEGNVGDECKVKGYSVESGNIYGYGVY